MKFNRLVLETIIKTDLPRLQCFPRGLGKGHDAALLSQWLKSVLDRVEPVQVPVSRLKQSILV